MKRVAFVSTIFGFPWGGADALWTGLAEERVASGQPTLVVVAPETAGHPRIVRLRDNGAGVFIRAGRENYRGVRGVGRYLLTRTGQGGPLSHQLATFESELLVLCQGGAFDFLAEPDLVRWLGKTGLPYLVIVQANGDHIHLAEPDRLEAARVLAGARNVYFVSQHNQATCERQLGFTLDNARLAQNVIERQSDETLSWPADGTIRFAIVARLNAFDKGLDLLSEALAHALPATAEWAVDVFGRGPDRPYLERLAARHGLSRRIRFCGFAESIAEVWRTHHMLLLPARIEGCSLAMMEAMYYGRPVLITKVGGAEEWVLHQNNGYVCDAPDVDGIARTLALAWNRRHEWPALGARAAATARQILGSAHERRVEI